MEILIRFRKSVWRIGRGIKRVDTFDWKKWETLFDCLASAQSKEVYAALDARAKMIKDFLSDRGIYSADLGGWKAPDDNTLPDAKTLLEDRILEDIRKLDDKKPDESL